MSLDQLRVKKILGGSAEVVIVVQPAVKAALAAAVIVRALAELLMIYAEP